MKLAVTGKGGVGKTTLSSLLARRLAGQGHGVLAVDADPDTNLAATLGFPSADAITPISEMKEMIFERLGSQPNSVGTFFKLNPRVEDIPEKYIVSHDGVRLIVMGLVKQGGAGCACPENTFLKALLSHILLGPEEDVVVDMEAGLEHLGRGTVSSVDGLLVVVEPTLRSLDTYRRVVDLASDIGLRRVWPVANKVESDAERAFFEESAPDLDWAGWIPFSPAIVRAHRGQGKITEAEPAVRREVDRVLERVARAVAEEAAPPSTSEGEAPQPSRLEGKSR